MPAPAWRSPDLPIRVGLSSCLLGEEVRYDGGHQKDAYITGVLGGHFTWVAVCPEMEVQHIVGFFKKQLGAAEKRELLGVIGDYARGLVPLVVPITLINHHVARFDVAYVRDQIYLHPHPKELMLRNHV